MQKYEALRRWKGDTKLGKWGTASKCSSSFKPLAKADDKLSRFQVVWGAQLIVKPSQGFSKAAPAHHLHHWRSMEDLGSTLGDLI